MLKVWKIKAWYVVSVVSGPAFQVPAGPHRETSSGLEVAVHIFTISRPCHLGPSKDASVGVSVH